MLNGLMVGAPNSQWPQEAIVRKWLRTLSVEKGSI